MNGFRAPNYPPDMFGQTQTHHGDIKEEASSENESEHDLPREDDDYEPYMEEEQQLELSMSNEGSSY
ncbi:hypothetical protein J1N35_033931 [Gossypium stocksii]|uniref:Uncharacterized protein n=1 Tax=Gossypium stocksii TaxID=47602 RepID=A0A9D3ZNU2_9ROSI|nr:hypothetical protein J1N35_033931 [Gossypium stocksii]